MTHCVPCSTPRHPLRAVLLFGLLAGLAAPDAPAAPPAPVAPITRFMDNGNGTVTDSLTGLTWLKNANCFGAQIWSAALSAANGLASGGCGLSDGSIAGQWRLPNVTEWQSLVDYTRSSPALPAGHPFAGIQADNYWSSTADASNACCVWTVNLPAGNVVAGNKAFDFYVWPVRGGQ